MTKEIELDEQDCEVFQDFVGLMNLNPRQHRNNIKVTEFEVKKQNGKRKYEIEFEVT